MSIRNAYYPIPLYRLYFFSHYFAIERSYNYPFCNVYYQWLHEYLSLFIISDSLKHLNIVVYRCIMSINCKKVAVKTTSTSTTTSLLNIYNFILSVYISATTDWSAGLRPRLPPNSPTYLQRRYEYIFQTFRIKVVRRNHCTVLEFPDFPTLP